MSSDPPQLNKPRGRGRQQTVPVEPHVAPLRRPADPAPSSVWGVEPATEFHPQGPGPRFTALPPSQAKGRATLHRAPITAEDVPETSAIRSTDSARGAVRGRRTVMDIIRTKPTTIDSKHGTTGKTVNLSANYFRIIKKPSWCLYQYRVDFSPDIESTAIRKGLVRSQKEMLGGYLFDAGSMLFTSNKLQSDVVDVVAKTRTDETIKITFKFVGTISMLDGHATQIFNIIMRRALEGLNLQLVGRNFFDAGAKVDIPDFKLQLWPGYTTSIRQHEDDLLMCGEITHKVMRMETVYDIILSCSANNREYKDSFAKAVVGTTVLTDYNNKTYRIDDVDWSTTVNATFETKAGPVSFVDYYKSKYNIEIRDRKQPLLVSKARARDVRGGMSETIQLVPELCRITGLTDDMRANFQLMKAMAVHTQIGPDMRTKKLLTFNRRLASTAESIATLNEWHLQLDPKLVELTGRELPKEFIYFANNKKVPTDQNADWTREFRGQHLYMRIELKRWHLICTSRNSRESNDFVKLLQQAGEGMGLLLANPRVMQLDDDRAQSYITMLETCAAQDPQLIMCVVPNNRSDRYSAIKKKCCVERAIPSQVMLAKTITPKGGNSRGLLSVATKVAIQMNCKLGAAPWMVAIPIKGLMTIGFDVTHDTNDKSKSYGALVATMDLQTHAKYFSAVSAHRNGEELSNELALNIIKALKEFRELHGCLPAKILMYRDGVGEGQLHQVLEHEIELVKQKLDEVYKKANVEGGYRMAFVIVSKRINTRIFRQTTNPIPGTVVDNVITLPERYDFFLVSQTVRQGTVAPTSYNVIHDNMGLNPDKMQILTYKMCHLYYNWSGTTRVPAVCQYAHKLAFLVGQFIHQSPSNALEKQLYFL